MGAGAGEREKDKKADGRQIGILVRISPSTQDKCPPTHWEGVALGSVQHNEGTISVPTISHGKCNFSGEEIEKESYI